MNVPLTVAVGLGVCGMVFVYASLQELSPLGEENYKAIKNGLKPFDRRFYTPRGRRFRAVGVALLLTAVAVAMFSVA